MIISEGGIIMAITTYRKLYPPIIDAKMDSFNAYEGSNPRLYFDTSILNSIDEINHMQISIYRLNSNQNALEKYDYPLGVMFIQAKRGAAEGSLENQVYTDLEQDRYYIELPRDWVTTFDQYYKLQIRFGEQVITPVPNPDGDSAFHGMFHEVKADGTRVLINQKWLNSQENTLKLSEWSTVCIIKPITPPVFGLQGFDSDAGYPGDENQLNAITSNSYSAIGYYSAEGGSADEVIDTYYIKLYNELTDGTKKLLEDSGIITIGEFNRASIQYPFETLLEEDVRYIIEFGVRSKSGFTGNTQYKTKVFYPSIKGSYKIDLQNQNMDDSLKNSAIKVSIKSEQSISKVDNFVLRRTSHRSNFKKWEDIAIFEVRNGLIFTPSGNLVKYYEYHDKFVESGVMYQYGLQPAMGGRRGFMEVPNKIVNEIIIDSQGLPVETDNLVTINQSAIVDYDYSWLLGEEEKQLNIAFNMTISSLNTVVKDSMIETIGGKYAFFTRNGNVKYKQLSLSGTITSHMDEGYAYLPDNYIILDKGYENEQVDIYTLTQFEKHLRNNRLNKKDTYLIEREFRTMIEDMLYDGKPKVLKTATEGMILGRISQVTLTPKTQLGRVIYDYSCQFTEIGEASLENLMKYKIKNRIPVFVEIPATELPYSDQVYADQTKAF